MIHDFRTSLALSNQYADAPWWNVVYRQAFPNMVGHQSVREDGWAQRGGIDRVIVLASGKVLTVDEKVRSEVWPDILLEYWSDRERRVPGWVAKDLACDYLAYAFVPNATCYLLPFQELRRVWRRHHRAWVTQHQKIEAHNNGYTTVSVAVPTAELLNAMKDAMTLTWTARAA